jgi:hypothetical protein
MAEIEDLVSRVFDTVYEQLLANRLIRQSAR